MCFTMLPVAAFADETPVEAPLEDLEVVLSSETTEDADELIREYITVSLQEEGIVNLDAAQRKKAYDSLTTLEKTVYDLLKEQIELVAAGERTDTRFAFTMKDLDLMKIF